jgi:2-amino-4-hydroxy-6-hydroxymethyldihydropteridine diphosphokinase
MNDVYLLIGGNIGNRMYFLNESIKKIEELCGEVKDKTVVYETEAWGNTNQAAFLNQVLRISTSLTPHELLRQVLAIEVSFGRVRHEKNGARTIDIDILYFNDVIMNDETLIIPHPRIAVRKFVLIPLAEIANNHLDPIHKISVQELLENCQDTLMAIKYTNHA